MATPTEPATDALYQALSSREPDPQVVHAAIEEIRYLSGHSVIAAISAQITEFRAEMDTRLTRLETATEAGFTKVNARIDTLGSRIDATNTRIDVQSSRIDVLQRVIWPLIGLLATTVFGLLYRVVAG